MLSAAHRRAAREGLDGTLVDLRLAGILTPAVLTRLLGGRHLPASREALKRLAAVTWRLRPQRLDPSRVDLIMDTPLLDCARARAELGWHPRYDARRSEAMSNPLISDYLAALMRQEIAASLPEVPGTDLAVDVCRGGRLADRVRGRWVGMP